MKGYVKIFRDIKNWKWYKNVNTFKVFIHCLISAYYEDFEFENIIVPRGSFITGRERLARDCGLTEQQIRTALKHLKSTNEITVKTTNKGTMITVVNYDLYQVKQEKTTNDTTNNETNDQPASNQQVTTNKNIKNNKNIYKKENIKRKKYFENEKVNSIFIEFLEMREKKKAVNSERAINTLINKIKNLDDESKIRTIENSIVNSWKSLFPKQEDGQASSSSSYYGRL